MIRKRLGLAGCIVLALAVLAPAASAQSWPVVFSYDSGTLAPPWQAVQAPVDRMSVTASPTDATKKVMRVELRHGDEFVTGGVAYNRAEVYGRHGNSGNYTMGWPDGENTERWYGWSTYFPSDFPSPPPPRWTIITQWPSMAGGTPPFAMAMSRGKVGLNYDESHLRDGDTTPLWISANTVTDNSWHTFVAHISWSWWSNLGFVELWHNGVQVVPKTFMATTRCCAVQGTAVNPYPTYLKMGIYRSPEIPETAVLYHGPMRIGTSKAMVEPPVPGG
jgi:hypothetical protein